MSAQQAAGESSVTTPGDRDIHVERVFDAPRERVFAAFTDPELIPQWWGSRESPAVVEEMDVRPGGIWRFTMSGADGEHSFRGVYREISPPERLVLTFEWEGMPGYVCIESTTFEDLGDGRTRIVSETIFHTKEERDGMLEAGMETGMNESFERLEELLASQA